MKGYEEESKRSPPKRRKLAELKKLSRPQCWRSGLRHRDSAVSPPHYLEKIFVKYSHLGTRCVNDCASTVYHYLVSIHTDMWANVETTHIAQ